MRLDAVVFDFDGVVIDTETARYEVWKKIFEEYGQVLPREIWVKSIGRSEYVVNPCDLLRGITGRDIDVDQLWLYQKKMEDRYIAGKPLTAGLVERLNEVKAAGARIAIASSASRRYVEKHLKDRDIFGYFDTLVCRDDVIKHKPDPEPYRNAVESLGAELSFSLAVEDSPAGIESAVSAGLFCVAIAGNMTREMNLSRAHCIVDSLDDITFTSIAERNFKL
ncbi:MAG: HAD family phosphatase [Chitinispirillaceae bacterium]|nr:HAD family phosphatase [Chitinispirillaceae bacterium]